MLTGVRTQEMRFATWQELDLEKGLWEIPAERMKMRRPHSPAFKAGYKAISTTKTDHWSLSLHFHWTK